MKYEKQLTLKNGQTALLKNCVYEDGEQVLYVFNKTHEETDFLLSYPEESTNTIESEAEYLQAKAESENEIEIAAIIDGKIAGAAGIESEGNKYKLKHRADFGISILKEYWGLGLGRELTKACIECAKKAGYTQLELTVVADNQSAIALYRSMGFIEYGRNPRGFRSKISGYQEVVSMRLELEE